MRPVSLIALLLCLLPMPTPVSAADLDALLASLRQTPPLSEPFHEIRIRRALKAPLVTSGTLAWQGGLAFERRIDQPYQETGVVSGRTLTVRRGRGTERVIPLARAPELQVLFGGLSALFAGDAAALAQHFEAELQGGDDWRLRLVPKQAALRERVPALELFGAAGRARCLVLRQDGADTLTLFGAPPTAVSAATFDELVAANCPAP